MGNSYSNAARTVGLFVAILALGVLMLGAAASGAYLVARQIVKTTVVAYGRALGYALDPAEVRFGLNFVQLIDVRFVALEIPGVSGTMRRVTIDLAGASPKAVQLTGVVVNATGEPTEIANGALRNYRRIWQPQGPLGSAPVLPTLKWNQLAVNLAPNNPLIPAVSVTELTLTANTDPQHEEYFVTTATTRVGSLEFGPLDLCVLHDGERFELGRGRELQTSPWRLFYRSLPTSDEVRVSFQPVELLSLLGQLGAATPLDDLKTTKVQGQFDAVRDTTSGRTSGTLELGLSGFTPPYPPELKGYHFDDRSTARAKFELDALFKTLELHGIELKTGELSLIGHGRIDREPHSARVRLELSTQLDCVTLARGWATQQLSGDFGRWSVKNAPKAIRGAVSVKVQIDAVSDQIGRAKIAKTIGIGCGLRPLSLVEVMNLGLPPMPDAATVERLMKQFPTSTLSSGLPKLPNLVPPLLPLPTPFGTSSKSSSKPKGTAAGKATTAHARTE